jgi:hypothetical protein
MFLELFEHATKYCFEQLPARVSVVEKNYVKALLWMNVNRKALLRVSPVFSRVKEP